MSTMTTTYQGNMLFETKLGNYSIQIDVPPTMGGSDRGPTPPELFVASLGSCIAAFAANYCIQAGIDPEGMRVDFSYEKADDPTRLINLKAKIRLDCDDYQKREKAILRVATHCPVHETISSFEGIELELVGQPKRELVPAY